LSGQLSSIAEESSQSHDGRAPERHEELKSNRGLDVRYGPARAVLRLSRPGPQSLPLGFISESTPDEDADGSGQEDVLGREHR